MWRLFPFLLLAAAPAAAQDRTTAAVQLANHCLTRADLGFLVKADIVPRAFCTCFAANLTEAVSETEIRNITLGKGSLGYTNIQPSLAESYWNGCLKALARR